MKITKVECLRVSRFTYVKVYTDEGITGIGELHPASGTSGEPLAAMAAVQQCGEYLLHKNAFRSNPKNSSHLIGFMARHCICSTPPVFHSERTQEGHRLGLLHSHGNRYATTLRVFSTVAMNQQSGTPSPSISHGASPPEKM